MTAPKPVYLLTLHAWPDGLVKAQQENAPQGVVARDAESAIAQAIKHPTARFRSSEDELDALRAALRGRQLLIQVRDAQLCSLGFR